jgi:glycosyltransferase involved in cell wall biosynthesis
MQNVLSISFLSRPFQEKVKNQLALDTNTQWFAITELRKLPLRQALATLLGIRGTLYLAFEDSGSAGASSLLLIVGFFTRAFKLAFVNEKVQVAPTNRWGALGAIFKLLKASVVSQYHLLRHMGRMEKLLAADAQVFPFGDSDKIFYLKTNLWFGVKVGGSIGHVAGVINGFVKKGHAIDYCSMEEPVMLNPQARYLAIPTMTRFGLPQEANCYTFQSHVEEFLEQIQASKYSFIYSRMAVCNYANVVLSRLWKKPLVLEYNGSEVWVSQKWGDGLRYPKAAQMAEDICLKHAQVIVVVSEVLRDELIERGIPASKIVCYPNCIEPEVFEPARFSADAKKAVRQRYGISEKAKVITFVGTFGQWHGAEKLAEAAAQLIAQRPDWMTQQDVHFLFVGDGLKMGEVKKWVDNPACQPFVTLTGLIPQQEAPLHLAASDILMSPHVANVDGSKFFGSPTKLFEYLAMEKGIVASDLDQIGVILQDSLRVENLPQNQPSDSASQVAVLTKPGDVEGIQQGIVFLVENPSWSQKLGQNARQIALQKYTWEHHVGAILAACQVD